MPEYLSVKEYAARVRVHEDTVHRWIKRGTLRAFKVGRVVRILIQSHKPLTPASDRTRPQ